jgi:hypothetical protein
MERKEQMQTTQLGGESELVRILREIDEEVRKRRRKEEKVSLTQEEIAKGRPMKRGKVKIAIYHYDELARNEEWELISKIFSIKELEPCICIVRKFDYDPNSSDGRYHRKKFYEVRYLQMNSIFEIDPPEVYIITYENVSILETKYVVVLDDKGRAIGKISLTDRGVIETRNEEDMKKLVKAYEEDKKFGVFYLKKEC